MFNSRKLRDHRRAMIARRPVRPWDHAKECDSDRNQKSLHVLLASSLSTEEVARRCGVSVVTIGLLRSMNPTPGELLKDPLPPVVESL
jgi:hypothetical protein